MSNQCILRLQFCSLLLVSLGIYGADDCSIEPQARLKLEVHKRLLLLGPSGCGKTRTAKALAQYCDRECVFVRGSEVHNNPEVSGSIFISNLFEGMLERKNRKFMLILDNLSEVTGYSDYDAKNPRSMQRRETALALCAKLDDCEGQSHICVVGTDDGNLDDFIAPVRTRFAHSTFVLRNLSGESLVRMMKSCLNRELEEGFNEKSPKLHQCRDKFLQDLAEAIPHLSMGEITTYIGRAKQLAIIESEDQMAIVKEKHLEQIFNEHADYYCYQRFWRKHKKPLRAGAVIVGGVALEVSRQVVTSYGTNIFKGLFEEKGKEEDKKGSE